MNWARTARIDGILSDEEMRRIENGFKGLGAAVTFRSWPEFGRTYALAEGPSSYEPPEAQAVLPQARWFPETVVALAIEPRPDEALPLLLQALGGDGAPAGISSCDQRENCIIVEFAPNVTSPQSVLQVADVELRRFQGSRCSRLLTPLTESDLSAIAASGLAAPEIAPNRILESLLEDARVE